jgi:uncharacterized protein
VDQKLLRQALDDTIQICVNQVGVEVNTASRELLARVAGLNDTIAANLVRFRQDNGPFTTRRVFLKVPRLGPKAFEQAAGFLRIRNGRNPLDASGIHPESYGIVEQMAKDRGCPPGDLVGNPGKVRQIDPESYVTDKAGLPTLTDILAELAQPGRDPRHDAPRHRDQCHGIRGVCGYRGAPGRPGAYQPDGGPVCQGPQ